MATFFTGSRFKKIEPVLQKPSLATLLNTIVWSTITLTPMLYYLVRLLFSGKLLYFSIGVAIITVFYLLMSKTIGMSKIEKGSSYGAVQNGK